MINYLEQGSTINGAYAGELKRLHQEIARKSEENWYSSLAALTSQVDMTAATECGFEILPHPPYSPDMAPPDFYLFPKLKSYLRGTQYVSNEGIIRVSKRVLWDQEKAFYFEGIRKPEQRWA